MLDACADQNRRKGNHVKKDNIKKLLTAKKKQAEAEEDKVVNMKQAM